MTIAFRAAGTATGATGSATAPAPAFPAGILVKDLMVLSVETKPYNGVITTPSGWTKVTEVTNGTTASGTDTGSMKTAVYVKIANGGDTGSVSLAISGANSSGAVINVYSHDNTTDWDWAFVTGIQAADAANYSATGGTMTDLIANDYMVVTTGVNGDIGGQTADALVHTGVTYGNLQIRTNADVTTGNDSHLHVVDRPISSVSGVSGGPTYSYTNSSSGSGSTIFLRLREVTHVPITITNNANAGTDAGTVTTVNSGGASGTEWDQVTASGGTAGTIKYDASQDAGASGLCQIHAIGVTTDECYVMWNSALTATVSTLWSRLYFYVTANPSTTHKLITVQGGSTVGGRVNLTTAGKLTYTDTSGTTIVTFTNSVALSAWNRVEFKIVGHTSAGVLEAKLFSADATTPIETNTSTSQNTGTTALDRIRFGPTGTAVASVTVRMDDFGLSDVGYLGPARVAGGQEILLGAIPI
jgi:hypothetical protein